jgi:hypothetical protein
MEFISKPATLGIFGVAIIMLLTGFTLFTPGATAAVHVPASGRHCRQPVPPLLDGSTGNVTSTGDFMRSGPGPHCPVTGFPQPSDTLIYYCYIAVGGDQFNTWTYASYTDVNGNTDEGWIPDTELSFNPPIGNGSGVECPPANDLARL